MTKRGLRRAVASLAVIAALLAPSAIEAGVQVQRMEIVSRQIDSFRIASPESRFGSLEFVGGLEMTSTNRDFGSMSGFRFRKPGSDFIGVADTGFWYFGRVERDAQGRPSGFAGFRMIPMADKRGNVSSEKREVDAEGLAVKGDIAIASFERNHRISQYRIAGDEMIGPVRNLDFLVPRNELRQNRGFETVAYAPANSALKGALVAVTEKSLDRDGNIFAAVLDGPLKGIFKVRRIGEFDVTDGAFLPNGDLLVLERSFSMLRGVAMRLRRLKAATIARGALADGPVLLEANMAYQVDNMEGMDIWRRADGALIVSIVSDDNQSILQRNLYLEFHLLGE